MANEKDEVVLEVKIDTGAAEKELLGVEKSILGTKVAIQDLNKAYKAGTITQDEFIEESVRLQAVQKKEQEQKRTLIRTIETESNSRNALKLRVNQLAKEYDNINRKTVEGARRAAELEKELADLNAQINKTSKSAGLFKDQIGNYPDKLGDAISSINVAGVSVGDLATKFGSFAGIATAVTGTVGALAGAYVASASGARDLENAQILLSKTYAVAGEGLANLINDEDDQVGILEKLTTFILLRYVPALYAESASYADAAKKLKDLEISRAFAAGDAKNDERRAEILRRIRDDEGVAIEDRIAASSKIDDIIETAKQRSIIVLKAEAQAIKESTVGYDKNREAQLAVAQITAEIADKEEEITGKLTENVTARRALIKLQQEQLDLYAQEIREANKPNVDLTPGNSTGINVVQGTSLTDPAIQASEVRIAQYTKELEAVDFTEKQKADYYRRGADLRKEIDDISNEVYYNSLAATFGSVAGLFEQQSAEYKLFASAEAIVATYSGATKAYDALAQIPYVGPALGTAAAAAAIVAGLANVAQINGVQFAAGGYTGPGFGAPDSSGFKPAGIVHEHEYVTPKRVVMMPQAQYHINALENMRTRGYADGGLVTGQATYYAEQAYITADAIENMPPPEVSVYEITKLQRRIAAREKTSRLS